ncbi:hypothetical protein [Gloeocapsopsis dulcis]|uniref:Uncharacterized protein n=1 Tax=Gloeocapsopsis dulcis AAB1 = 1H9 TaxID=1433147 RepID=A0A6N8G2K5_9CHRO|nr:hypothetical protein [Gloeocapsopsis dulcis]MUL39563.1 hypothetical protein [Gloeocapsopsis dulcis AAB1 = 1H9]WNN92171.1 hypothetical protein P0S91_26735 [Gloeocapsopsis dulcis]
MTGEANGIRIGIVKEGFGIPGLSEADVDEIVMAAAYRLEKVCYKVSEVSMSMHRDGLHI